MTRIEPIQLSSEATFEMSNADAIPPEICAVINHSPKSNGRCNATVEFRQVLEKILQLRRGRPSSEPSRVKGKLAQLQNCTGKLSKQTHCDDLDVLHMKISLRFEQPPVSQKIECIRATEHFRIKISKITAASASEVSIF